LELASNRLTAGMCARQTICRFVSWHARLSGTESDRNFCRCSLQAHQQAQPLARNRVYLTACAEFAGAFLKRVHVPASSMRRILELQINVCIGIELIIAV
jgi:hypothetical protein